MTGKDTLIPEACGPEHIHYSSSEKLMNFTVSVMLYCAANPLQKTYFHKMKTILAMVLFLLTVGTAVMSAQEYPINLTLQIKAYEQDFTKEYIYCSSASGNVYRLKVSSPEVTLTNILSPYPPVFAKHANYAVYLSANRLSLRLYYPTSGADSLLLMLPPTAQGKNTESCRLSFSPGGRYLLINHNDTSRVYDFQTKQLVLMKGEYSMNEFSPFCWSDEETKIFYFAITRYYQHILKKVDILTGATEELLTTDTTVLNSDRRSYFAYNPVNKILAYGITLRRGGIQELHFYNVQTRRDTTVLKASAIYTYWMMGTLSELAWNNDNTQLAFRTSSILDRRYNLHCFSINGSGVNWFYNGGGQPGGVNFENINWINNTTLIYQKYGLVYLNNTNGFVKINDAIREGFSNVYSKVSTYPNPTTGEVHFELTKKINATAVLSLYSSLGEKIAETGEVSFVSGLGEVNLSSSIRASGVYIYRLSFPGERTQTLFGKLVFVK